mgnify:CR=1 FL=1
MAIVNGTGGADTINGGFTDGDGDQVTGGADTIFGLGGNDTIDGLGGADTMFGGAGDDTYEVDNVGDIVSESSGQGTDLVNATGVDYTLTANVENLTYTGSGSFIGTGSALDNVLTGGTGSDMLSGAAGNDTIVAMNGKEQRQHGA